MRASHPAKLVGTALAMAIIGILALSGCISHPPSLVRHRYIIENHSRQTFLAEVSVLAYGTILRVAPCSVAYSSGSWGLPYGEPFEVAVTDEDGEVLGRYTVVGQKDEEGNGPPITVAYLPDGTSECPAPLGDVYEIVIVNATAQTLTVRYAGEGWGTWTRGMARTLEPFEESMYDFDILPLEIVGSDGMSRFPDELVVRTEERNVMGEMPTMTMTVTHRAGRY